MSCKDSEQSNYRYKVVTRGLGRRRWRYPRSNTWFPHLANWSLAPFFPPPPPPLLLRSYTDRVFFQAGSSSSSPLAFCARTFNFAPRWQTATDKKRGPLCSLCLSQSASFLSRAILVLNCARANARTTSGFSDSGERLIRLSLSLPDVSSRGPMFFNP